MSQILSSTILGIIQGLGEFLPISSSGHLVLARSLFNLDLKLPDSSALLAFDIVLHLGTLMAVLLYFRKSIARNIKQKKILAKKRFFLLLFVATLPGALLGLLAGDFMESFFRNPFSIAAMLLFFGLLLFAADRYSQEEAIERSELAFPINEKIEEISFLKAFIIGSFQALALIPGISRAGATITAGLFLGLNRKDAARFSFMLSVPIILGAALLKIPSLFQAHINSLVLVAGFFSAFVVGFLSIKYMLKYLTSKSYLIFVIYRVVLASLIFALILT